jgi:hypothetical protein
MLEKMASIPKDPNTNLPPWSGPALISQDAVPVSRGMMKVKDPRPASFPITQADNDNLFPPVCIRSHWDPTQIIKRTLPTSLVATPLDPRPWTKVCLNYVTTQEFEDAPRPDDSVVYPSGGTVYPPSRYREAVDQESELRRLDRPLGTCERDQYIPPRSGDMYRPNATLPDRNQPDSRFISELAFPSVCMREGVYDCVADAQQAAWARSPMPFNNATKQARYAVKHPEYVRQLKSNPQPIPTGMQSLS